MKYEFKTFKDSSTGPVGCLVSQSPWSTSNFGINI